MPLKKQMHGTRRQFEKTSADYVEKELTNFLNCNEIQESSSAMKLI